ncbi:MAG: SGNH/GDSL hydrolase family protein, partial [bacterium]
MNASDGMFLQKGDRVVFYGDSITEQQLYTNYVEAYLAARYPELSLSFFNAGWGGDTAPGGLKRLDRDVLSIKPTVVTLCYGMNDGQCASPSEAIRNQFVAGMRELVARLKEHGVRVVLMTPGMVDESVNPGLKSVQYNMLGLRMLADEVLKLAATEQLPVCDIHKLMNDVDTRAKAAVPGFCMIPDSVHPDPAGHLVMAFGLLRALGVPARRLEVSGAMGTSDVLCAGGISSARMRRKRDGCVLAMKIDSLPFFVEPAARKVLPFLPFQETFNECKL